MGMRFWRRRRGKLLGGSRHIFAPTGEARESREGPTRERRHESRRVSSVVRIHFSRTVVNGPGYAPSSHVEGRTLLTKDLVTIQATGIQTVGGGEHGQLVVF